MLVILCDGMTLHHNHLKRHLSKASIIDQIERYILLGYYQTLVLLSDGLSLHPNRCVACTSQNIGTVVMAHDTLVSVHENGGQ